MPLIYDIVDGAFRIFMWMLLDPAGRSLFYALDALGIVGGFAYLIWDYRSDDALEKARGSGDTGTQRKGAEGKDEGIP